jgi:hypothetical protein
MRAEQHGFSPQAYLGREHFLFRAESAARATSNPLREAFITTDSSERLKPDSRTKFKPSKVTKFPL